MTEETISYTGLLCPVPLSHNDRIVLGHGSGGRLSHNLINKIFLPHLDNPILHAANDAGVMQLSDQEGISIPRLAISTDSHVVSPLFFPGGDIGKLSVCGTVNDVAMMGATPLFITAGFILEEGLEISILEQVVQSMQNAAQEAGVLVVAGDTKVVQRGKADGLYITTAGIGTISPGIHIGGEIAQPDDIVILSGTIGDHGIAVLQARGELGFQTDLKSDVSPLNHLIKNMLLSSKHIHVLRDPTRGGLATSLNEIAQQSKVCIELEESKIPVKPEVSAACEMLGFDPLYVANEGKLIAIVAPQDAEKILDVMHSTQYGEDAIVIGRVKAVPQSRVLMRTMIGSTRVVDMLSGELLPRIC